MNYKKEDKPEFGRLAEQFAADYLLTNGYVIRERNWRPRSSHLEVDIIAQIDHTIVFVEVKARTGNLTDPAEAVDNKKIKRLVRAAAIYFGSVKEDFEYRFDIITITPTRNTSTDISDRQIIPEEERKSWFAARFAPKEIKPTLVTPDYTLDHITDAFIPPVTRR